MHVTIVSYTFPPSKEIGGRRWAKFSQYLSKMGHEVTVICRDHKAEAGWYTNEFPGVDMLLLPKRYPDWLSGYTSSAAEKLLYFLAVRVLGRFTKQNLFDRGFAWRKPMLAALENLHQRKRVDVLVVTGAPFSLLYYGAQFKLKHPEVLLVSDFRDPWTWGTYYGIPEMLGSKKRYQEFSERAAIDASDLICYPTEHMGDVVKKMYPHAASRCYLLPHAYEPDKFPKQEDRKREGFIYGGTLYAGTEEYIKEVDKVMRLHADIGCKWFVYTGSPYPLIDDSDFGKGWLVKRDRIPEEELFREIAGSAAYLAIYPVTDKDFVSTKFFEIIYTGTPIVYIGEEGEVGKFVRENRVGVHILPADIAKELPKYLSGQVPFEKGYFDVTRYTFGAVTANFVKKLEEQKTKTNKSTNEQG